MQRTKLQPYFLFLLLGGALTLTFFIFRPFFQPLVLAAVFALVFRPLFVRILHKMPKYRGLAAAITTLAVSVFICVPLIFLSLRIISEVRETYTALTAHGGRDTVLQMFESLVGSVQRVFPAMPNVSIDLDMYLQQGLGWFVQNVGVVFSEVATLALSAVIFLISLYYLIKDGDRLQRAVIKLSPLSDKDDRAVLDRVESAVTSVMRGSLVVAIIQGFLTAIGFTIFGVPNAVLWGAVASLAALIPGVGTALVLTPAIIYLFVTGQLVAGAGLLLWGGTAVGLIDNILGPKLISRRMQMHPLWVFLSVIGGLALFGPLGFLLGPVSVALLFALLEIYTYFFKTPAE